MIRRTFLAGSVGALAVGTVMLVAPGSAAAAESVVQTVSLDEDINSDGSGTVEAFDPALGTLTSVTFAVSSSVELQSCVENLSPAPSNAAGGPFEGSVSITFPADVVTAASHEIALPAELLDTHDGVEDCGATYDAATVRFPTPPSAADLQFVEDEQTTEFAETLTATADLAPYIGPGTVPFSYAGDSFEGVSLAGEWDLWFIGHGQVDITITYTYEPLQVATTTTTTSPTTPSTPPPCIPPGGTPPTTTPGSPTTTPIPPCSTPPLCVPPGGTVPPTVPGSPTTVTAPPTCSTAPPCIPPGGTAPPTVPGSPTTGVRPRSCSTLPETGSTTDTTTALALFALAAGLGLLALTRRRAQTG